MKTRLERVGVMKTWSWECEVSGDQVKLCSFTGPSRVCCSKVRLMMVGEVYF